MANSAKRQRRLQDAYAFPGFRPQTKVRGLFGDVKARVIALIRRSKKRSAAVAVVCTSGGTIGAFGGFEYIAILAGETRAPARSVGRSVLIAAPIIAIMFILGTATVVAYVPTDQIALIGPLPQVLRIGFGPFGIAGPLVTIAILMTLAAIAYGASGGDRPLVSAALKGVAAAATGLLLATFIQLASKTLRGWLDVVFIALAVIAVNWFHVSVLYALIGIAVLATIAYRPKRTDKPQGQATS